MQGLTDISQHDMLNLF